MEWACENLLQPDGPNAGQPWEFTEEQMRFVAWYYAINERGGWRYTSAVLRRMKGWGKDPLAAVLAAIEFVGPCRFGGWDKAGEPIVVPQQSAWVQIAAVAEKQTRNTMVLFPSLFSKRCIAEYGIDIGKEIIYGQAGRAQIQAVANSPKTLEGARSTFVIKNEIQHWLESNDGHEMSSSIRRNTAKTGGRTLAITNAHRIGELSVAEHDWEKYQADGDAGEMLYDSLEAPVDTDIDDDASLRAGLLAAAGDSYWVPIERLMIEMRDQRETETTRRRFYLNQIRQESDTWIGADEWRTVERDEEVAKGTQIALGFDGSRVKDTTALVATTLSTGYQWVVASWTRPDVDREWEVPEPEVQMAVEETFARYDVARMYCDPWWWEETISRWSGKWPKKVAFFYTNSQLTRLARALKAYETAVVTRELWHARDPQFAEHIAHVVKRDTNLRGEDGERLYTISKEHKNSGRKIDIAMAAVLSWAARNDALADGALKGPSIYESRGILVL